MRSDRPTGRAALPRFPLLATLLVTAMLWAACGRQPPVVLLISLDTFRADALGVLSHRDPSPTPHLDRFASEAIVFENAFCQIPHTLVSHMSMMTGLYPEAHGVTSEGKSLSDGTSTMAQIFHDSGYSTAGVVTSEWLKPAFGFERGFDSYTLLPHKATYAERVNSEAARILDTWDQRQPLFLFLHYYDAHSDFDLQIGNELPYYAPEPIRDQMGLTVEEGEFCLDERQCATRYLLALDQDRLPVSPEIREKVHQLYMAGVYYLDELLGLMLEDLRKRGLFDRATILITSDHGEEFREHGRFIHSQPYDETTHVPLLVKLPEGLNGNRRIDDVVETIDLLPTILDLRKLEIPHHTQGRSLVPRMGNGKTLQGPVLSQDSIHRSRFALRTSRTKFIMNTASGERELYDLNADPGETHNLLEQRRAAVERAERQLLHTLEQNSRLFERLASGDSSTDGNVLTDEERKNLEALGYLD